MLVSGRVRVLELILHQGVSIAGREFPEPLGMQEMHDQMHQNEISYHIILYMKMLSTVDGRSPANHRNSMHKTKP